MRGRKLGTALGAMMALATSPVLAAGTPPADKVISLVQAAGCDMAQLKPRLETIGQAIARNRRTSRVIIDWPSDPGRNLDLMSHPSPFVAALEVNASPSTVAHLAHRIQSMIGTGCNVGTYLVHERRLMSTPRTWQLGEPSPRPKTLITLNRKQGLTFEAFDREWAGPHARLALAWRSARGGSGHYVQNLVVGLVGRETPPLDGIGEAEGPGVPSPQEREARVKTAAHAQTFQDMQRSAMFIVREVIVKD